MLPEYSLLLVFGKAFLLLEIQLLPVRVVVHEDMTTKENPDFRLAELEALDEDRLAAQQNLNLYCH